MDTEGTGRPAAVRDQDMPEVRTERPAQAGMQDMHNDSVGTSERKDTKERVSRTKGQREQGRRGATGAYQLLTSRKDGGEMRRGDSKDTSGDEIQIGTKGGSTAQYSSKPGEKVREQAEMTQILAGYKHFEGIVCSNIGWIHLRYQRRLTWTQKSWQESRHQPGG